MFSSLLFSFRNRCPSTTLCSCGMQSSELIVTRRLGTTQVVYKVVPENLKGKSVSSQNWLKRQLNDPYVTKARYANYRARSAWKMIQMDDSHKLVHPGQVVVELGAAPGAWTQVLVERLGLKPAEHESLSKVASNGMVVSLDLNPMHPVPGAHVLQHCDFTKPINQAKVLSILDQRHVDLVASDMAPNATGTHTLDHEAIIQLVYAAFTFSIQVLKPRTGAFLAKIWDGSRSEELNQQLERFFNRVDRIKPDASRCDSSEIYILAREFRGLNNKER